MASSLRAQAQAGVGDRQREVLGHVEALDDAAHAQRDGLLAAQRVACALRGRGDLGQIGLGGRQQLQPLARTLLGQQRVAAHHQPLVGEVLARELQQVALVEQRGLEGSVLGRQLRDLRRAQGADPVHALGLEHLLDARRGQHAAVAHPGDALDAEALLELGHLRGHRGRVGGVALEHLHRDRAALGRADQAEDDLRVVALAVARMTRVRPARSNARSARSKSGRTAPGCCPPDAGAPGAARWPACASCSQSSARYRSSALHWPTPSTRPSEERGRVVVQHAVRGQLGGRLQHARHQHGLQHRLQLLRGRAEPGRTSPSRGPHRAPLPHGRAAGCARR